MNWFLRWSRFNLVGALGTGFQLAVLALLNRLSGHYLITSTAAIELTLLHNFAWHIHYTWRDRRHSRWTQLVRFHLSNGVVSVAGNLALMPLLVRGAHMPILAANGTVILCCSIVNFLLGDCWAFRRITQV